jgi:anti-repressor protein
VVADRPRVELDLSLVLAVKQDVLGQVVNARDLYAVLEVKTAFKDWILRRIEQIRAKENVDFTVWEDRSNLSGGQGRKEYAISLTLAKHLCMMEGGAKGNAAREYFLNCERTAQALTKPMTTLEWIDKMRELEVERIATAQENRVLEVRIEELEPAAEAYEKVVSSDGLLLVASVAQILGTGQNLLYAYLRHKKVLIESGDRRNHPRQQYVNDGYFKLVPNTYKFTLPSGQVVDRISSTTHVTPKGLDFIRKLWDKKLEQPESLPEDGEALE